MPGINLKCCEHMTLVSFYKERLNIIHGNILPVNSEESLISLKIIFHCFSSAGKNHKEIKAEI